MESSFFEKDDSLSGETKDLSEWWSFFSDPQLESLITRAQGQNLELIETIEAIREARALHGATESDLWPRVDVNGSFRRTQDSETTAFGGFQTIRTSEQFAVGFDASWEIDLFGKIARGREATAADIAIAMEASEALRSSLVAECALRYIELRTAQVRERISQRNLALQTRTLEMARARHESGLAPLSDVLQATANSKITEAVVPNLRITARTAANRLAVLLGLMPGALSDELMTERAIPVPPMVLAVGVPSELLRNRPDIRQAERRIAKETALIGVAEADLYPSFSLFGNLGLQSQSLDDLTKRASAVFGIGPSISWNLFDRSATWRRIDAQTSRRKQAVLRYESTVLNAVEEAESAMTRFVRGRARREILLEGADAATKAREVADAQYRAGLSDFLVVLEADRTLASIEDEIAILDGEISVSAVTLFKALGGGTPRPETASRAP
jgi:NodT family efflux transporter outer membrane factor (OMF) lipoprotein